MDALLGYVSDDSGDEGRARSCEGSGPASPRDAEANGDRKRPAPDAPETAENAKRARDALAPPPALPLPPADLFFPSRDKKPGVIPLEDPHQGRARAFPHVEGNYAVHVFIPVAVPPAGRSQLSQLLARLRAAEPGIQPVRDGGADEARLPEVMPGGRGHPPPRLSPHRSVVIPNPAFPAVPAPGPASLPHRRHRRPCTTSRFRGRCRSARPR